MSINKEEELNLQLCNLVMVYRIYTIALLDACSPERESSNDRVTSEAITNRQNDWKISNYDELMKSLYLRRDDLSCKLGYFMWRPSVVLPSRITLHTETLKI